MSIKLDYRSRKTVAKIRGISGATDRAVELAAYEAGKTLQKATNTEILRKPKGGKTYITRNRAGARRRHVASAPNETHANFSGALRRSLGYRVTGHQIEFGYGVVRGDAPDYAAHVEFGTKNMVRRPSVRNGIVATQSRVIQDIERGIARAHR